MPTRTMWSVMRELEVNATGVESSGLVTVPETVLEILDLARQITGEPAFDAGADRKARLGREHGEGFAGGTDAAGGNRIAEVVENRIAAVIEDGGDCEAGAIEDAGGPDRSDCQAAGDIRHD